MIRLTTASIERFGVGCTMKLLLMAAVSVGCLMAALAPNPQPKPATMQRCVVTTLDVPTGTTTMVTKPCPVRP